MNFADLHREAIRAEGLCSTDCPSCVRATELLRRVTDALCEIDLRLTKIELSAAPGRSQPIEKPIQDYIRT